MTGTIAREPKKVTHGGAARSLRRGVSEWRLQIYGGAEAPEKKTGWSAKN